MGKCPACAENECEGKHANREICEDKSLCTCACQGSRHPNCEPNAAIKNSNTGKCPPCAENKCERKYANRNICERKSPCTCACQKSRPNRKPNAAIKDSDAGKCPPCTENKCERKYANRDTCEWRSPCTCACQESRFSAAFRAVASVTGGLACVAVGVSVTVLTVGAGASVGGAIMGTGTSLVIHPISKAVIGERMQGKELLKDVAVSATVGSLSGGVGAIGGAIATGASTVARLGIQMASGALAGGVGGAVTETARLLDEEKDDKKAGGADGAKGAGGAATDTACSLDAEKLVPKAEGVDSAATKTAGSLDAGKVERQSRLRSLAKSVAVGAVCGAIGGASGRFASGLSSKISSGMGQAFTRVGVQTVSATATDAGVQLYENGGKIKEIDWKRLAVTSTSQLAVGAASEGTRSQVMKTRLYTDKLNERALKQEGLSQQEREVISERLKEANDLQPETREAELKKVSEYNELRSKDVKPAKIGDNNAHFLTDDRTGQIALDIKDENGNRGGRRVVADYDPRNQRFVFADYTDSHDYKNMRRPGENFVYDSSVEGLGKLPVDHYLDSEDKEEEDKRK